MKVLGLDGKFYQWNLMEHQPLRNDERVRSELHIKTRALLKQLWPTEPLLEELHLPGSGGLFIDFFLPNRKLVIESSGEQHYKYVKHFHGDMAGFVRSKVRDENKRKWCEINKIRLAELKFDKEETWLQTLTTA